MFLKYFSVFLFIPFISCSQEHRPETKVSWFVLGQDSVSVSVTDYGGKRQPVYINLHDDERTSLQAAIPVLKKYGGVLIKINNSGERNLVCVIDSASYKFDPNRIFSRNGIVQSLVKHKRISNKAIDEIEKFARFILDHLPEHPRLIIALHNNINGSLSISSYSGNGEEAADAAAVSRVHNADPDDFMLTTERTVYELFRNRFNVVLQDNHGARQDGSLSVYFAGKGIPYINCETQHGHLPQFSRMLLAIHDSLDKIIR
ncbi:MAG: hypothetical protein EOO05_06875 [Chitinophagaceae bacterium]|nr:MAG: hypothetical protein EOO05_06875 [Chitinophagaceae bacterium]